MIDIVELDPTDRKILGILLRDASRPISDIADEVGLTTNPCWRRIKRMEEQGVITGRVVLVDPTVLGLTLTSFVTIKTDRHDKEWLNKFAKAVDRIPEIVECHRMTGDVDYLLKIIVRDISHYDAVYQRLLELIPSLSDVTSTFSMETLKRTGIV